MRRNDQKLILVHATSGRPTTDDYDIWDDKGRVVGRVFRAANSPKEQPWFWTVTERAMRVPTDRGYTATREEAMAAFRRVWLARTGAI
jgi:hypothetical protein